MAMLAGMALLTGAVWASEATKGTKPPCPCPNCPKKERMMSPEEWRKWHKDMPMPEEMKKYHEKYGKESGNATERHGEEMRKMKEEHEKYHKWH